ncbi:hypothetical protein THIOM_005667 [Candidatus Thiomargarita nelsonii]|uniref:Uncharacterized protein n=1 Tax=Candidatus Thiomargarita nelsonii TaxID=1003181 RepID=A0A0A6P1P1_9GAMM|nr:hypothetical protein THIOM_005667 [Candidatus Thiomargarita nelsonii]
MPSFDLVNYALRPNKNVERKIIVECLSALQPYFNMQAYRYVGLGSLWFIDFILVHKMLQIKDMISIEKEEYAQRAEFNKPFACIEVKYGETTTILPQLSLGDKPSIVWLDYDSGLEGPVLGDTFTVCRQVTSGSVFLITVNAHPGKIRAKGDELTSSYTTHKSLSNREKFETGFRYYTDEYVGDLKLEPLPSRVHKEDKFPKFIGNLLLAHIKRATRQSGNNFKPLFNFYYKDGAPMVTVGGMIANQEHLSSLEQCQLFDKFEYLTGEEQYSIGVPLLTPKEKLIFDQLLPSDEPPSEDKMKDIGLNLTKEQIAAYHKFYRLYPMFGEFL